MATKQLFIILITSYLPCMCVANNAGTGGETNDLGNMEATLKVDIDSSKMKEYFKDYIQQEVQNGIKLAMQDLIQRVLNRTDRIQTDIEQNIKDQRITEFSSFSAYTTYDDFMTSDAIKYDKVRTNIGQDYDTGSGKFTAPVTGLYCISFSMMGLYNSNGVYIFLMKNQSEFTRLYTAGSGRHEVSSNTVFMSLSKGDTVWVKGSVGKKLYAAEPYNMFSGTLIRSGSF